MANIAVSHYALVLFPHEMTKDLTSTSCAYLIKLLRRNYMDFCVRSAFVFTPLTRLKTKLSGQFALSAICKPSSKLPSQPLPVCCAANC